MLYQNTCVTLILQSVYKQLARDMYTHNHPNITNHTGNETRSDKSASQIPIHVVSKQSTQLKSGSRPYGGKAVYGEAPRSA